MHDHINDLALEKWELYNLEADRSELHNLAAEYPELVEELATQWMVWAERVGAIPKPLSNGLPQHVKARLESGESKL